MTPSRHLLPIILSVLFTIAAASCNNGKCKLKDECSSDGDCEGGLHCISCYLEYYSGSICVRSSLTPHYKHNKSKPFNKYAFLTTHNSYAIEGEPSRTGHTRLTTTNQEDSITKQLKNGVRALMLDPYDFKGDVWLCHGFEGICRNYTAFKPAVETLKEIESFLSTNKEEVVTLFLEDYVKTSDALKKVFNASGLMKYWFPVSKMPKDGGNWPSVKEMIDNNERLVVFSSNKSKEKQEGIAYQWNYMVETKYGEDGMENGCHHRDGSSKLDDKSKALVLVNYFMSVAVKHAACSQNSGDLEDKLKSCHNAAGNRWANFVAVDYYKRSDGGGAFKAVDAINSRM